MSSTKMIHATFSMADFSDLFQGLNCDVKYIAEALRDAESIEMAKEDTFIVVEFSSKEDGYLVHGFFKFNSYESKNNVLLLDGTESEASKALAFIEVSSLTPSEKFMLKGTWRRLHPRTNSNDYTVTGKMFCQGCNGTGWHDQSRGQIHFRCQGRGYTTIEDRYRNAGYDQRTGYQAYEGGNK